MAPKPFPLLKLPLLPIADILRHMGHIDAFVFSRISKRTKRIVKAEFKPPGFILEILVADVVTLTYKKKNELSSRVLVTKSVKTQLDSDQYTDIISPVASWHSEKDDDDCQLVIRSDDLFVGLKKMYAELTEVFKPLVNHAAVWMDEVEKDFKPLIHWLDNLAPECPKITIFGKACDFGDCMWTLGNIKSIKNVVFDAKPNDYAETIPFRIDADGLHITHGRWAKPAHLQSMVAKRMVITNVNLTDEEIIEILDNVRNGLFNPNMEVIHLRLNRQLDLDAILPRLALIDEDGSRGKFRQNDGSLGRFISRNYEEGGQVFTSVILISD